MPSSDNPLWIDGQSMAGAMLRRADAVTLMSDGTAGGARGGVRPGDTGLVVSLSGTTINVTAGVAALNYAGQGLYRANMTSAWTGTVAAADATLPRIDLVYLRVWDNAVDSSGLAQADVVYLQGTAASSPVAPTPSGTQIYIPLANISVPAVGGGNPSVDTSVRPNAIGPGGIGVGTSTPGVHAGQYRDTGGATGTLQHYNGSAWEDKVRLASGGQVNVGGTPSAASFATITPTPTNDFYLSGRVSGDNSTRFSVRADGTAAWGPGNAAQDVSLARSSAATLTLTGNLAVTGVGGWLGFRKTSSQSVTSSTTLVDDAQLQMTVAANGIYRVEGLLIYNGDSTADMKIGWVTPSGTFDWVAIGQPGTATATSGSVITNAQTIASNSYGLGCLGTTTNMTALVRGILAVGATGGTFKLQFAQNTSSTTATTMVTNSHVMLQRIA